MDPLIGGAIIGTVGNVASDLFSESNARNAFKHRYQDTVKDIRAAGLNPALAYGQGGGNPQTVPFGDWGSEAVQAGQTVSNARQAAAQADLTKSQATLLKAQSADIIDNLRLRNHLVNADVNLRGEQLSNLNVDTSAKTIARDKAAATYESDVAGTRARNKMPALLLPEADALAKWFRAHPDLAGWINSAGGIKNLLGAAGGLVP